MPIFFPKVNDEIITGTIDKVAAIGPIGIVPRGVKQNINSIATIKQTFSVVFKFTRLPPKYCCLKTL